MKFNYINAVIYNRDELASEFSLSDSIYTNEDLLLRGYQILGEDLFNKINGDFAFSFYDDENNILYAARDALGVKALYYVASNGKYYFSHNIDTLLELSGIEKKLNLKSIRCILKHIAVDYEDTMYENIYRVPQGHYLKITQNKVKLHRYWYPEKIETNYKISLDEASDYFRVLFKKAILARVGSDKETAYELSGGLDSSSVVSMLHKKYPQKQIDTYSMCFNNLKCDELSYINAVEDKYNFKTTKIASQSIDYKNKFNFNFNYKMNPHWPITTTFTMIFPMIEKMSIDGKKIIITGQGGDHLLSGQCIVLGDLLRRGVFKKVFKEFTSGAYTFKSIIICAFAPLIYGKVKKVFKRIDRNEELTDLFGIDKINPIAKQYNINAILSAAQSTMMDGNALHVLEEVYNVEFRHPFYDKNLVEFVLSLPPEYLYSQGWIKMLLRYSMEDILPDKIRSRDDKADFYEVLFQQLNAIDVKSLLKDSELVSLGIIEQKELNKLIEQYDKEETKSLLELWTVVNLEYWYQYNNDQK